MSAIIEAELISSPMLVPRVQDLPPLTFKQSAFVRHYIDPDNQRNGTQAAIKAGYTDDPTVGNAIASENLRKPSIQAHIQHAIKARHISPDDVLAELSDIALLPKNALQSLRNPESPYSANHKLKALELAQKYFIPEQNDSSEGATRELITILQTLTARARELQAQPAQIPASVGEQTT